MQSLNVIQYVEELDNGTVCMFFFRGLIYKLLMYNLINT